MPSSFRTAVVRYGAAIAAVIVATAARLALDPVLGDLFPFLTLLLGVMVTAAISGRGPALLATALGAFAAARFLLQPRDSFAVDGSGDRVGLGLYLVIGAGFAALGGALREARKRAEAAADIIAREREETQATLGSIEERLRLFLEHAPVGVAMFDRDMRYLLVSRRWSADFGLVGVDVRGRSHYEVFPDLPPHWKEAHRRCLEGAVEQIGEESFTRPDGREEWLRREIRPWRNDRGEIGGIIIFSEIITEQKRDRQAVHEHAEALAGLLRERERQNAFINAVLAQVPAAIVVADAGTGQIMMSNEEAHRIVRHEYRAGSRLEDYGNAFIVEGRRADGSRYEFGEWPLDRALRGEAVVGEEIELLLRNSGRVSIRVNAGPIRVGDEVVAAVVAFHDITARKAVEQTARFLADASAALAGIADYEGTLQRVASLAVPTFADWALIDLAEKDGPGRRLAVAHSDPSQAELALAVRQRYPHHASATIGASNVLRTGRFEFATEVTESMLAAGARDEADLSTLRAMGLKSYICVPLLVRGAPFGVLTFLSTQSGRRYTEHDLAVAQDLASRAAIAIENARLYAELKDADQSKNQFLATLAHELRNPLAPIRNVLEVMRNASGAGDGFGAERAMVERQIVHLTRLIDDLMDVARISRGKIELRKEEVDLATIVNQAVETSRPLLVDRRHELTVELPEQSVRLEADPTRLEQVLWNLLNNAAKYTEPGGRIAVAAECEAGLVVVRVRDSGIGIKPEMLPRIFDMFVQAGDTTDHTHGGLGIGLSLVRTLVEMHGGSITASSAGLGQGSEFVVRLPILRPARAPRAPEAIRSRPRDGKPPRCRILVVDDNIDAARSLGTLLALHGQDVRVANDGLEALAVASEFQPEVVLLDIGMPRMDGNEVARRLRQRPEFARILVVALTGWGQDSDVDRSRAAGFDHHLVKPADPGAILDLLTKARRANPSDR